MAKSFKKFREEYDDEWGDDDRRSSERKKMKIRDQRRKKAQERFYNFKENSHEND